MSFLVVELTGFGTGLRLFAAKLVTQPPTGCGADRFWNGVKTCTLPPLPAHRQGCGADRFWNGVKTMDAPYPKAITGVVELTGFGTGLRPY